MKSLFMFLFSFLLLANALAQTQMEMNADAASSYRKADQQLNAVYKQIMQEYREDSVFTAALRESQRIWVKLRDAELKMKYPPREEGYYGSAQSMCESSYLEQLTLDRVRILKQWTDGVEDDECMGTMKGKM